MARSGWPAATGGRAMLAALLLGACAAPDANAVIRTDPVVKNTCLSDPASASAVFFDTQVKVTEA